MKLLCLERIKVRVEVFLSLQFGESDPRNSDFRDADRAFHAGAGAVASAVINPVINTVTNNDRNFARTSHGSLRRRGSERHGGGPGMRRPTPLGHHESR